MSSEYGWTDDQILDLPIARLRQITAAILQRQYLRQRQESGRFSWLARHLGTFIAGGYMLEDPKNNPAMERAQTLAIDDVEEALLGVTTAQSSNQPVTATSNDEAIARALERNSNGSFERFAGAVQGLNQRGKML